MTNPYNAPLIYWGQLTISSNIAVLPACISLTIGGMELAFFHQYIEQLAMCHQCVNGTVPVPPMMETKAVNREDKRSRRYRDRHFAKFERSRRYYRDRYRC
jgi:hypothetical protein